MQYIVYTLYFKKLHKTNLAICYKHRYILSVLHLCWVLYIEKIYLLTSNGGSKWVETLGKKLVVRVGVKGDIIFIGIALTDYKNALAVYKNALTAYKNAHGGTYF